MTSGTSRILVLVLLISASVPILSQVFAADSASSEGLQARLEGLTLSPFVGMTDGALKAWHEDDWIPMRLTLSNNRAPDNATVSVFLEYMNGERIGIDSFASCFSDSGSCGSGNRTTSGTSWRILVGSTEVTPTVAIVSVAGVTAIRWTLDSVSIPQGTPVEIRWASHLSKSGSYNLLCSDSASPLNGCSPKQIAAGSGAGAWPGNSLQVRLDQPLGQRTLSIDPPREQQQPTQQPSQQCIIATAAYGSELASPVQFLRQFRDHDVSSTVLGAAFVQAFNNWYYPWATPVARSITPNEPAKLAVRTVIFPLIGTLMIADGIFALTAPLNAELGILIAGLIASAIIGAIYLVPVAYVVQRASRRKFGKRALAFSGILAVMLALYGTLSFGTTNLQAIASSILVLTTLIMIPTLIVSKLRASEISQPGR